MHSIMKLQPLLFSLSLHKLILEYLTGKISFKTFTKNFLFYFIEHSRFVSHVQ